MTPSGRKHEKPRHTREAMINAGEPVPVEPDQLHWIGKDSRGEELHIIAVTDNHESAVDGDLAIIHSLRTSWRKP